MGQPQKARDVLYKYLEANPALETYLKVAKFEFKNRNKEAARKMFEQIIVDLGS
jgi:TolA-binding protein